MKRLIDMCKSKIEAILFFSFLMTLLVRRNTYVVSKVSKCKIIKDMKESVLSH